MQFSENADADLAPLVGSNCGLFERYLLPGRERGELARQNPDLYYAASGVSGRLNNGFA